MAVDTSSLTFVRRLAVGGTCELDLVETADGDRVVRKRPLRGAPPEAGQRLALEGRVLAQIDSPHVVRLIGAQSDALLLEHLDGVDLDQLSAQLRRRGETLPLPVAWAIVYGVGRGLAAIHDSGYVHADLGPTNVMLTNGGRVVLIDLGLTRSLEDAPPAEREGTLAYQPPEQLRGQSIDVRADLYALGLLTYELLTGMLARPAGMLGAKELLEARRQRPKPPSTVRPELGATFDEVVLWALEPQASARPPSVEAWLARLPQGAAPEEVRQVVGRAPGPMIPSAPTAAASQTLIDPPGEATLLLPTKIAPRSTPSRTRWWLGALVLSSAIAVGWMVREQPAPHQAPVVAPAAEVAHASPSATPAPPPVVAVPVEPPPPPPRKSVSPPSTKGPAPKPSAPRIEIHGDVQVSGGGQQRRAPWSSGRLLDGATMLELSNGELRALVRVEASATLLTVTIGAPPGTYYQAECSGRSGATPLIGVPLAARMACTVQREDGANMRFELRRID